MLNLPSRCGAVAFVLTAGLFGTVRVALAQNAPASETTVRTDAQGRRLAPHDTFYTLVYVSARTDKGVEGFPPGTEVHLVSVNREAHTLTVTDGHANVEVSPDKLTNDLDMAAMVKIKDDANQARIAAYQQAQGDAYQKYLKEVADYTNKDLQKREQEIRDANARVLEQANASQQQVNTNASYNGYYNEGGYGYGNPYGYFVDLNPPVVVNGENRGRNTTVQTEGNRSTITTTQNGNQVSGGGRPAGGTQTGGGNIGGGTAGGGKKP